MCLVWLSHNWPNQWINHLTDDGNIQLFRGLRITTVNDTMKHYHITLFSYKGIHPSCGTISCPWPIYNNQSGLLDDVINLVDLWKVPDSKVHGANMGPTWGRKAPGGPYVGDMNFAIWGDNKLASTDALFWITRQHCSIRCMIPDLICIYDR